MAASQESSLSWTSQSLVTTTGITNITVTKANKDAMEITIFMAIIGIKAIMEIIIGVADFNMYCEHCLLTTKELTITGLI
jgi:hypothetical protein